MASKSIYCVFAIFVCVVLANLPSQVRADKNVCKDAQVPADFDIKKLDGVWYEIQRKNSTNTFDSGFQCVNLTFTSENNSTGKVVISMSHEKDKKLVQDTQSTNFTFDNEKYINFAVNNVSLKIKVLTTSSNYVVSCGFANAGAETQAWVFSKKRQLENNDKKGVNAFIANFTDFGQLTEVEQNEKKCNGAGSVVPVVSVLALTIFTVLKAF